MLLMYNHAVTTLPSLARHTLRRSREEGSGHTATTELSPRNTIIRPLRLGNKVLTSTKHVTELYSMTTDALYEDRGSDWSQQVSVVATTRWLQRDQTFLSLRRVWLARLHPPMLPMHNHACSHHPPMLPMHNHAVTSLPCSQYTCSHTLRDYTLPSNRKIDKF